LKDRPGGDLGQISIMLETGRGQEVEITLPGRWPVDAGARAAIKAAPEVAAVEEA
jgi:DNA polymerase-3 subunit alpha